MKPHPFCRAEYDLAFRPGYPSALIPHLKKYANLTPEAKVLDIGCGTGQLTTLIAPHAREVTGIDSDLAMITAAKGAHHASHANIIWQHGRAENLNELPLVLGSYTLAVIGRSFHLFPTADTLNMLRRFLIDGGVLAILGDSPLGTGPLVYGNYSIKDIVRGWLVQQGLVAETDNTRIQAVETFEESLSIAGFRVLEKIEISLTRCWQEEQIIGQIFATDICSPRIVEDFQPQIISLIRDALATADRSRKGFIEKAKLRTITATTRANR